MSALYDKIVSQRNSLERLAAKIPGLRGYAEMSARREADRILRTHVSKQFEERISHFIRIEQSLMDNLGLAEAMPYMERTKRLRTKLENLHRRIASDSPGYSGFFGAVKVQEDELERIYAFDEALLTYAEQLSEKLSNIQSAISKKEGIGENLDSLDSLLNEADEAYTLRDDILNGIS